MSAKLLQSGDDYPLQVLLAMLVADDDRYFTQIDLKGLGNSRGDFARLILGG
jgi:hypothetical protein